MARIAACLALAATVTVTIGASRGVAAVACERLVISGDPEYPPLVWFDGQTMRGSTIEIAAAVARRIHLPYDIRYVGPFPRVLLAARNGEIDLISEMKDTPERRDYVAFPATPIFVNPIAVFTRRTDPIVFKRWDDLIDHRGGITLANKFGGGFDEFLARHLNIEEAPRLESGFAMLAKNRIEYFVTGYYPGLAYLIQANEERQFIALEPYVTASDNFIGLAKRSRCISRLADIDAALVELIRAGEVQRILQTGFDSWRSWLAQQPATGG
ncbi:MAG: transporter substrate-binding domain-containing protein [Alphaproteobacteria bacterium]|nr:transporter substrate-binding domain-containing protein [Alphaproteobacteria bacterium]